MAVRKLAGIRLAALLIKISIKKIGWKTDCFHTQFFVGLTIWTAPSDHPRQTVQFLLPD